MAYWTTQPVRKIDPLGSAARAGTCRTCDRYVPLYARLTWPNGTTLPACVDCTAAVERDPQRRLPPRENS